MDNILSNTAKKILHGCGYNINRSFSSSIAPLQILDRSIYNNVFDVIGKADEIFYFPQEIPKIKYDFDMIDISGTYKTNLSVKLTLSFLESFLKKIILNKAQIELKYGKIRSFTTKFSNCTSDIVYPLETWRFLKKSSVGGINYQANVTKRILDNYSIKNPSYIVTETLKAKEIKISVQNEQGVTIKPDIELLDIIKINPEFEWKVNDDGEITIKSGVPHIFAFKACPLWIDDQIIVIAPPIFMPNNDSVVVADIPMYSFAEASSLNNPDVLTSVLLSDSGTSIRITDS